MPWFDAYFYSRHTSGNNARYYTADWTTRETFTGLYGQKLSKYGYEWPTDYRWFNDIDSNYFTSIMDMFGPSVNDNPSSAFHSDFYGYSSTFDTSVRHFLQNEDGSWPSQPTYTIPTGIGNGMIFRDFSGFTASQFRIRLPQGVTTYYTGTAYNGNNLVNPQTHYTNTGWTDWLDYGTGVEYAGNTGHETTRWTATEGGIDFRYTRNTYNLTYMVGKFVAGDNGAPPVDEDNNPLEPPISGELLQVSNIAYEHPMGSYAEGGEDYYEPDALDGYVFGGWYVDATCTTPVDFENITMPLNGMTVYGKWVQKQYRVFLHPNVPASDTSLDWGGQAMSFRVDYGEHIAGGNPILGTRDDYELIGWYTDEAYTQPFNFAAYVLNDTTVTTPYDQTQPTELNVFGNPTGTENRDSTNNRFWIEQKLDLYAKWRAKLEGARGINVVYDANGGSNEPHDMLQYLDSAQAVAGAASTAPDPTKEHFLHWVVQTWDEEQGKYVDTSQLAYPGDIFEVLKANAKRVDNPEWTGPDDTTHDQYIYTVQLRAEYGPLDEPTPTHITWYDNFTENPVEGTNYVTDPNLQINEAVNIEPADLFEREGYRFLGWARVDTTDAQGHELSGYTLEPRALDEDDLFLKYEGGVFKAEVNGEWTVVDQVAADEVYPYHDLYAVWVRAYPVTVIKHVEGAQLDTQFTFTPDFNKVLDAEYHTAFQLSGAPGSNTKVFEEVPENSTFTIGETEDIDFVTTVKYSIDAEGTEHDITDQVIANGGEITVTGAVTVEFTNTGKTFPVTVKKVDQETDEGLPGAVFALTKKNDNDIYVTYGTEEHPDGRFPTNADGEISLQLPRGEYQLEEQVGPAGYIIIDRFVQFTVDEEGVITVTQGDHASLDPLDRTKLKVANEPGTPLPHTGGAGTGGFTVAGMLLLLGSAILLFVKRKKA